MNTFTQQRKGTGTYEWSEIPYSIQLGCSHGCLYCYARYDALKRFKRIATAEEWLHPVVNKNKVKKKWKKRDGVIMFPTTHDITPHNLSEACEAILNMVASGNKVLIVSKPQMACITVLCDALKQYSELILFRFSIGAIDSQLIDVFEPHASTWQERIKCLKYAYEREFQTSVSAEPLLGGESMAEQVYQETIPYITDTLWFGFLNKIDQRILEDEHLLYDGWTLGMWKEYIRRYITYEIAAYCASLAYLNPKVRLKDSMVKMLREDRPYVIID